MRCKCSKHVAHVSNALRIFKTCCKSVTTAFYSQRVANSRKNNMRQVSATIVNNNRLLIISKKIKVAEVSHGIKFVCSCFLCECFICAHYQCVSCLAGPIKLFCICICIKDYIMMRSDKYHTLFRGIPLYDTCMKCADFFFLSLE